MRIIKISVMRGPNYWSIKRHKLIAMVVDLEHLGNLPSDEISGVRARVSAMFPSMLNRRHGVVRPGGRLQRVGAGMLMGQVVEHIALEIQSLAGMDTGFGCTRAYGKKGVCHVVFAYLDEAVGVYAATASVRIAESIAANEAYDPSGDIGRMRELHDGEQLDPGISEIIREAASRGIPWFQLRKHSLFQLGYGANQERIRLALASRAGGVREGLTGDNQAAKHPLQQARTHVPNGESAASLLDRLYPPGRDFRIPIISVTGTNGKTTTSRLVAHLFRANGYTVGHTMTDGIYVQDRLMESGDCAGPQSAAFVLKDPSVTVAVLETARGGLLRAGLGYAACDVGIVTNVEEDHLGENGIRDIRQMARLKAVVADSVRRGGYAILNADDQWVYRMGNRLKCNVALFSMDEHNPRIRQHARAGHLSAIYENECITICNGEEKLRVARAVDVPLTMGGNATFMIQNILPAVMAAYVSGMKIGEIDAALKSFFPSVAQTPGRINLFRFREFTVLLDFAHNAAGFKALKHLVDRMDGTPKVGIIAGLGDRRRKDNLAIGRIAAEMFDEIILRQDKDLRGRTEEEIIAMVREGIAQVKPVMPLSIIASEDAAITHAISSARKGSLLVICAGFVPGAVERVTRLHESEG